MPEQPEMPEPPDEGELFEPAEPVGAEYLWSDHEPPSVLPLWAGLAAVWLAVPVLGVLIGALTDPLPSSGWYALIGVGLVAGTLVLWRWITLQQPPDA